MDISILRHTSGTVRTARIAKRLSLSLHTVETHRWRIMDKLDLHSTADLVLSAVRRGLVT